jgi:hypothetical protein
MKALNLNNFLSCRLLSRRPTQCRLVPLLCRPSPCHPRCCRATPCRRCAPPCHATPCHTTHPSLVMPPSLMSHCASLVLAGCCIALSLVAPTSLSRRLVVESPPLLPHHHLSHRTAASLITPPLSLHAIPLILHCASLVVPLLRQWPNVCPSRPGLLLSNF